MSDATGIFPVIALVAIGLGFVVGVIAWFWFLFEAFRLHIGWGIAYFLLPFVGLILLFLHPREVLKPFLAQIFAFLLTIGGLYAAVGKSGLDLSEYLPEEFSLETISKGFDESGNGAGQSLQDELKSMQQTTSPGEGTDTAVDPVVEVRETEILEQIDLLQRELVREYEALSAQHAELDPANPASVREYQEALKQYEAKLERKRELEKRLSPP